MSIPKYNTLTIEEKSAITWIVLDRPQTLNALSDELLTEFSDVLRILKTEGAPVIGIRGAGRGFSSGYDISPEAEEIGGLGRRNIIEERTRLREKIECLMPLWDHPKPTIAAVHGPCIAGAVLLASLCDLTVVADNAVIGEPTLPIGGGFMEPFWAFLLGPKQAKMMALDPGARFNAAKAVEWGWANFSVPHDELVDAVEKLSSRIARVHPDVLAVKKSSVNRYYEDRGIRSAFISGAETDALLHFSEPVRAMSESIRSNGLADTIKRFYG
ncbi:enoyl-CoA hydratase/isomerase family protein [Marinobacter sp. 71-i]|uniref:Enoyl-CoA hydratase/isomerase family protein n=1 Tax=Marinobacter iranensis TaxID=2962607 RepID=A0ABT5YAW5_9GAMM|nr:enoyl-CoA hydratase/isomerase family protein [Marinobacter iranensis]MDF0750826.1 enoyl-CoA hydratase/isomerase family protein [Marinobacter iranensis]